MNASVATSADYADALLTARRAKNVLFAFLLLFLLGQIGIFFAARYTKLIDGPQPTVQTELAKPTTAAVAAITAAAAPAATQPAASLRIGRQALAAVTAGIVFMGMALAIVLALVLLLIVKIMLVGRLIGVSRLTSAYLWCILLVVLLFPWQAFFANVALTSPEFRIPGVLYTWTELLANARFGIDSPASGYEMFLRWARFVGFPVVALILLLVVQTNGSRGLKMALGEAEAEPGAIPPGLDENR